jgi:hypothetical protein
MIRLEFLDIFNRPNFIEHDVSKTGFSFRPQDKSPFQMGQSTELVLTSEVFLYLTETR